MDSKLFGRSLQYHGVNLLKAMHEEQQEFPASVLGNYQSRKQLDTEIKDERFLASVRSFIARKADILFKPYVPEEKEKGDVETDDLYAIMPPLDAFAGLPFYDRKEHFHASLSRDDCVTGVVKTILESGLLIRLLCVDVGPARHIQDLDITAYCPAKELPRLYAKESALDAFQEKDIVRGIVLSVESERIILSLHERSIPDIKLYPRIGLITEDEFPVHFRRIVEIEDKSYEDLLHSIMGFNNSGNVKALLKRQGLSEQHSYLRYMSRLQIPEKEYAEGLKKWQSLKLAHQSVAMGVDKFKSGSYQEAMQHFNKALQIDDTNVEALVARGALLANKEVFEKAVADFRLALTHNPTHSNARSYLVETLLTMGKTYEDNRRLEDACDVYKQVLEVDASNREAQDMLDACNKLLAIQGDSGHPVNKAGDGLDKGKVKDGKKNKKKKKEEKKQKEGRGKSSSSDVLNESTQKLLEIMKMEQKKHKSGKKSKKQKEDKYGHSPSDRSGKKTRKRKRSSSFGSSSSDSDRKESTMKRMRHMYDDMRRRSSSSSSSSSTSSPSRSSIPPPSGLDQSGKAMREAYQEYQKSGAGRSSCSPPPASKMMKVEEDPVFKSSKASPLSFFSKSTFIPGLGDSPPAPQVQEIQSKAKQPLPPPETSHQITKKTVIEPPSAQSNPVRSSSPMSKPKPKQHQQQQQQQQQNDDDKDDIVKDLMASLSGEGGKLSEERIAQLLWLLKQKNKQDNKGGGNDDDSDRQGGRRRSRSRSMEDDREKEDGQGGSGERKKRKESPGKPSEGPISAEIQARLLWLLRQKEEERYRDDRRERYAGGGGGGRDKKEIPERPQIRKRSRSRSRSTSSSLSHLIRSSHSRSRSRDGRRKGRSRSGSSSSSSGSGSSSGSSSSSGGRRGGSRMRDDEKRKLSKTGPHIPNVTGVAELDMYLGGRDLVAKMQKTLWQMREKSSPPLSSTSSRPPRSTRQRAPGSWSKSRSRSPNGARSRKRNDGSWGESEREDRNRDRGGLTRRGGGKELGKLSPSSSSAHYLRDHQTKYLKAEEHDHRRYRLQSQSSLQYEDVSPEPMQRQRQDSADSRGGGGNRKDAMGSDRKAGRSRSGSQSREDWNDSSKERTRKKESGLGTWQRGGGMMIKEEWDKMRMMRKVGMESKEAAAASSSDQMDKPGGVGGGRDFSAMKKDLKNIVITKEFKVNKPKSSSPKSKDDDDKEAKNKNDDGGDTKTPTKKKKNKKSKKKKKKKSADSDVEQQGGATHEDEINRQKQLKEGDEKGAGPNAGMVPRVLMRKPRMDDPNLTKNTITSKEFDAMEREKRRRKKEEEEREEEEAEAKAKKEAEKQAALINMDDIEKEIERRVQERLKMEEAKLMKKNNNEGAAGGGGGGGAERERSDDVEGENKKSYVSDGSGSSRPFVNRKGERIEPVYTQSSSSNNTNTNTSRPRPPEPFYPHTHNSSSSGSRPRQKFKETGSGWNKDIHGRPYFAVYGTVHEQGFAKDIKGNVYYVGVHRYKPSTFVPVHSNSLLSRRFTKPPPLMERSRSRSRRSRSDSRSRSRRSRSDSRSRASRSRSDSRSRGRRSRSDSRSRARRSRSDSRSRSRRRGGRRSSSRSHSRSRSRSSSGRRNDKSSSTSKGGPGTGRTTDEGGRNSSSLASKGGEGKNPPAQLTTTATLTGKEEGGSKITPDAHHHTTAIKRVVVLCGEAAKGNVVVQDDGGDGSRKNVAKGGGEGEKRDGSNSNNKVIMGSEGQMKTMMTSRWDNAAVGKSQKKSRWDDDKRKSDGNAAVRGSRLNAAGDGEDDDGKNKTKSKWDDDDEDDGNNKGNESGKSAATIGSSQLDEIKKRVLERKALTGGGLVADYEGGGKDEEGDDEDQNNRDESLTELEKFLKNLKQKKKDQWIAEGKIKEKD